MIAEPPECRDEVIFVDNYFVLRVGNTEIVETFPESE